MSEQNKAIASRIPLEAFNQGKLAVFDEVFATDFVDHTALPGLPAGREGVKQFVPLLRAAFPDLRYTVDDAIAEGDKVVQRITVSGTHKGEFMGIPATGKHATWMEIHITRIVGSKVVEHWGSVDRLGMMQQLGVAPAPGQAGTR